TTCPLHRVQLRSQSYRFFLRVSDAVVDCSNALLQVLLRNAQQGSASRDLFQMLCEFLLSNSCANFGVGGDKTALALAGHDHALALQFEIGSLHRNYAHADI